MSYAIASVYYGTYLEEDSDAWMFELDPESEDDEGDTLTSYTLGEGISDCDGDIYMPGCDTDTSGSKYPLVKLIGEKFQQLYTDSGPRVFVLGQKVGEFDETEGNYTLDAFIDRLSRMRGELRPADVRQILETHVQLPDELRRLLPPIRLHVIWSRS